MSTHPQILLIRADATPIALPQPSFADCSISYLDLRNTGEDADIPAEWSPVSVRELMDEEAFSQDFLEFLERWPQQLVWRERCFDELFQRRGGYSLWWTGPAVERLPDQGILPLIKALWLCDRAIRETKADTVWIATQDCEFAAAINSRCSAEGIRFESQGAKPRRRRYGRWDGLAWLGRSLLKFLVFPFRTGLRSLLSRRIVKPRNDDPQQPAIVFASGHQGYLQVDEDGVRVPWWDEVAQSLRKQAPSCRQRYLIHAREANSRRIGHPAWRHIADLESAAPIKDAFPAWPVQASEAPRHLLALWRYFCLERQSTFRDSFRFAGADVSAWYLPRVRRAVQRSFRWNQEVAAIEQSLRAVGNVSAVIVGEEMYGTAMPDIAAAHRLDVPVVGFQHGMIFPMHAVFTLPQGQISGAPTPDYFAVFGDYAREVVTRHGRYPDRRVWVTGMVRHDELHSERPDRQSARQRLGLPLEPQIALVTTQITPWFPEAVRAVIEAVRDRPDLLLYIKPHPRENRRACYEQLIEESGLSNVQLCDSRSYQSFRELLPACDVVLSAFSTTLLEATLLEKPSICLNFSDEPDWYPYVADGASLPGRNRQQVAAALDFVLNEENRPQWVSAQANFLRRHAMTPLAASASDLLVDKILAVCNLRQANTIQSASEQRFPDSSRIDQQVPVEKSLVDSQ